MAELQGIKGIPTEPQLRKPSTYTDYLEGLKGRIFKESVMEPGFIESLTAHEGSPIDYQNISSVAGGRAREMFVDPMRRFGTAIDKGMTGKPLTIGDQLNLIEGMIDTTIGGLFQHSASKGFKNFDPNTLHMFVGPKAKDIVKAEKMAMRGASPAEIQSKLLMHKKPDGMWRKEISDADMALDFGELAPRYADHPNFEHGRVGDVIKHPELFKKVPGLEDITFQVGNDVSGVREAGNYGSDILTVYQEGLGGRAKSITNHLEKLKDPNYMDRMSKELLEDGDAPDIETARRYVKEWQDEDIPKLQKQLKEIKPYDDRVPKTVGHELQHAVQQKEGWARGGSPNNQRSIIQRKESRVKEIENSQEYNDIQNRMGKDLDKMIESDTYTPEKADELIELYKKIYPTYKERVDLVDSMEGIDQTGFEQYQNLLGEREARSTAERLGMSLEERRGSLPDVGEGATVLMRGIGDVSQPQASYPVYQGRSKKGLTDFTNPDKVAWGTTDRGTAEQFADVKESYFPYRKPPETVREMRGEVYDLDFDIKKPMDVDISETLWSREKELAKIQEAKDKGFDGLRIKHPSGKLDYVAFSGDQVTRSGESDIKSISTKLKESGVDNFMYERGDTVTIQSIKVPKSEQGKGVGTKAMEDVLSYADGSSKVVALTPSTDFGASSVGRLKKFYKNLGFVENKGKNKDYEISESMYRLPE